MPDFASMVRERLSGTQLGDEVREDVVREIAGHMESSFEGALQRGMSPEAAKVLAVLGVQDWEKSGRAVRNAKEDLMNERLRRMWVPGVCVSVLNFAAINVVMRTVRPSIVPFHGTFLALSVWWWAIYVACGALGSGWCKRIGGTPRERLVVALFPAMMTAVLLTMAFVMAIFVDRQVMLSTKVIGITAFWIWAVMIPAVFLLIGAGPFLREKATFVDAKPKGIATTA